MTASLSRARGSSRASPKTDILVVGPGAVGCLFAALLAGGGHRVRLLDRDAGRARRLSAQGIEVREGSESFRPRIPVVPAAEAASGACELLCICVKAHDTAQAVRDCLHLLNEQTLLVSLQNGLGNAETIAANAPPAGRIVCAATGHGVTRLGPGLVRHAGSGMTHIAPLDAAALPAARRVRRIFETAGIAVGLHADANGVLWSKLAVNAAINPLTAIHRAPNGRLIENETVRETLRAAAREVQAVARAKGISLLYEDAEEEAEEACRATRGNLSSMLQDIREGKRTEIEAINGAVVREADALGLPAPVNRELLLRVRELERLS